MSSLFYFEMLQAITYSIICAYTNLASDSQPQDSLDALLVIFSNSKNFEMKQFRHHYLVSDAMQYNDADMQMGGEQKGLDLLGKFSIMD